MKEHLDHLYATYNRRRYIHPDPLECVYRYKNKEDREIVAMVASAFAFGRVGQILLTLDRVLGMMGSSPRSFLQEATRHSLRRDFHGFVYRFVREPHVCDFLFGLKRMIEAFGSLEDCFKAGLSQEDETIVPPMVFFMKQMVRDGLVPGYLMADPQKGSACKRMNLFLRWMVRKDRVDPGGWNLPKEKLIVPLDTHMHKICLGLGLTTRKQGDMKTAVEITRAFGRLCPDDPVKYDFALTRFGIREDMQLSHLFDTVGL